jgi:ribosome recycling factor
MTDAPGQALEQRMSDAVGAMDRDLNHIRTGRASTSLVERLPIDYYGTSTPLNQLASISVPESSVVVIQPWDRGVLGAIEKAIQKSDIGISPNVDGTVVRLNIPPLTEERRRDLVKLVHKRMEEAKVEIRNHRRDAVDAIRRREKDGEIGADEAHRESEAVERSTQRWIGEVDRVGAAKEQEVLEV